MKPSRFLSLALGALFLLPAFEASALDLVEARISFKGTLRNTPARQSIGGFFVGSGEIKALRLDASVGGKVSTRAGERVPAPSLLGEYPVDILVRARKFGGRVSRTFSTKVQVRRKSIRLGDYGKINLVREINPRRVGGQRIRGKGVLRFGI